MPLHREELLIVVEENPESFYSLLADYSRSARYEREDSMRKMSFGVPLGFLNGVSMARLDLATCDQHIASAVEELNSTGLPWYWQVGPGCLPYDLRDRLLRAGLKLSHEVPAMAANLSAWEPQGLPEGLTIRAVLSEDEFELWLEPATISFGLPETFRNLLRAAQAGIGYSGDLAVRHFTGFEDGQAVAVGTVYYAAGVAGIFTIGTVPEARKKGYGAAITEACMRDAVEKGYDTAILHASKMGLPVYERLGFQEVCKLSNYVVAEP